MKRKISLNRRQFLQATLVSGVGLVISVTLPGCDKFGLGGKPKPTPTATEWLEPNLFVTVGNNDEVVITVPRSELGQGVRTALAQIVAEELCADWKKVRVEQAPGNPRYGDQTTGGSTSVTVYYTRLREAGALGRDILIQTAAQNWKVDPKTCYAENSMVYHRGSDQKSSFGELVAAANQLPEKPALGIPKPESEFKLIGTNPGRVDNPLIVTGKAVYGLDVRRPGMLFAVVARSPVLDGEVKSFTPDEALKVPGVKKVLQIGAGVAVVAENTWAALQGRKALKIEWEGGASDYDSATAAQKLMERAAKGITPAEDMLVQYYSVPYLAHATMEPMNCLVEVKPEEGVEVWAPTQNPQAVLLTVSSSVKGAMGKTKVNVPLVGGGFGRRLESSMKGNPPPTADYVRQAVELSQAMGAPVQVMWTREDDLQNDLYHPMSVTRVSAKKSDISSLQMQRFEDYSAVPTGAFRAVENIPMAFAHECFVDEFAQVTGADPVELRRKILPKRALPVLELAISKSGWGQPLGERQGRGVAYHSTWGDTQTVQVVEVSVSPEGQVQVKKVVCAVDCGVVINPEIVKEQMEGGILFGLTTALKGSVEFKGGVPQVSNFTNYPLLRMDEAPEIEVYILQSSEYPSGIGEMSNPIVVPALLNAIYAATGKRIRSLPVKAEDLK